MIDLMRARSLALPCLIPSASPADRTCVSCAAISSCGSAGPLVSRAGTRVASAASLAAARITSRILVSSASLLMYALGLYRQLSVAGDKQSHLPWAAKPNPDIAARSARKSEISRVNISSGRCHISGTYDAERHTSRSALPADPHGRSDAAAGPLRNGTMNRACLSRDDGRRVRQRTHEGERLGGEKIRQFAGRQRASEPGRLACPERGEIA